MLTPTGLYWQTSERCRSRWIGSARNRRRWQPIRISYETDWSRDWQHVHEGASITLHSLNLTVCLGARTVCPRGLPRLCADKPPPCDCVSSFSCTLFWVLITCHCCIYFILFLSLVMYILFYCICFIFDNSATSSNESIPFDWCGECNGFYNSNCIVYRSGIL